MRYDNEKKVLVVGTAEKSGGGVTSVIRLMRKMPVWDEYQCYWLETQIQSVTLVKLYYALKSYIIFLFVIWKCSIVHFHCVPDGNCLFVQFPIFFMTKMLKKKILTHLHVGNQLEYPENVDNRMFRWWLSKSDIIVLLSNRFCEIFNKHYLDIDTPITCVYNACDSFRSIPYSEHNHTIIFVGAFRPNKGGQTLINAFVKIHRIYPDWKLIMLGDGPEKEMYCEIVEKCGIADYVEMPGYLNGEQLSIFFEKAGIFCLCSHHEGFPMVVLEAWGYNVPVITTPVGGLPDVIEDGYNSLVFDYGNVDMLVSKLRCLIENESLRYVMSERAHKMVNEKFNLYTISDSWSKIYSSLN